jgi:CheY-like chemotaxis protein
VIELQRAAPLAGMYAVLGSWCEGEARSGKPWSGVTRCYWHTWPARWHEESERFRRGDLSLWSLPVTATEEERLLGRSHSILEKRTGCIVVVAESPETRQAISDAMKAIYSSVVECHAAQKIAVQGANAIILDTTLEAASDPEKVKSLKARFSNAPLLALVTFPRHHDIDRMYRAGVNGILAKPWLIEDLHQQLAQLRIDQPDV